MALWASCFAAIWLLVSPVTSTKAKISDTPADVAARVRWCPLMISIPRSVLAHRGRLSSRLSLPIVWARRSNIAFGIDRAFTSCSRRIETGNFQSSNPLPSATTICPASGWVSRGFGPCVGACGFAFLPFIPPPLPVLFQPVAHHIRKTVVPEISPINNAESTIVELFARDHLEGAPIGLAFLVNGDGSRLKACRLVQIGRASCRGRG